MIVELFIGQASSMKMVMVLTITPVRVGGLLLMSQIGVGVPKPPGEVQRYLIMLNTCLTPLSMQ